MNEFRNPRLASKSVDLILCDKTFVGMDQQFGCIIVAGFSR